MNNDNYDLSAAIVGRVPTAATLQEGRDGRQQGSARGTHRRQLPPRLPPQRPQDPLLIRSIGSPYPGGHPTYASSVPACTNMLMRMQIC